MTIDDDIASLIESTAITPYVLEPQPGVTTGAILEYDKVKSVFEQLRQITVDLGTSRSGYVNFGDFGGKAEAGFDNTPAINLAIAEAIATGAPGVCAPIVAPGARFEIAGRSNFDTTEFVGWGVDETVFLCTAADAGFDFTAVGEVAHRGTISGRFRIMGGPSYLNGIATRPLVFGQRVMQTFANIQSWYSADGSDGVTILCSGTQNCAFLNVEAVGGRVLLRFDGGASNNQFIKGELAGGSYAHLEFRNTIVTPNQGDYNLHNVLDGTILEVTEATTKYMVRSLSGAQNTLRNCPVYVNGRLFGGQPPETLPTAMDHMIYAALTEHAQQSSLVISKCIMIGYDAAGVGIHAEPGAFIVVDGGSMYAFPVGISGAVRVNVSPIFFSTVPLPIDTTGTFLQAPYNMTHVFQDRVAMAATHYVSGSNVLNDAEFRYIRDANGSMLWGPGDAIQDTVLARDAANRLRMGAGDFFVVDGTWNGGKVLFGGYALWVDGSGKLRIKNGAPSSDTDGTIVGTQS